MAIYVFVDIILFILFLQYREKNTNKLFFFAAFSLFFLITMHDGHMTNDYEHYQNFFTGRGPSIYGTIDNSPDIEKGYIIFVKFLRLWDDSELYYRLSIGLVVCVPWLYLVHRHSACPILSILLLMVINQGANLQTFFCAHRQMLAISSMLVAYSIFERKVKFWYVWDILLCAFACYTHSTSLFIIPLFLILLLIPITNKISYLIITIVSLVLHFVIDFNKVFIILGNSLVTTLESNRASAYLENDYSDVSVGIWPFLLLSFLFLIFLYFQRKEMVNTIYLKCFLAAVVLKNILGYIPLVNRFIIFFLLIAWAGSIPTLPQKKWSLPYMAISFVLILFFVIKLRILNNPSEHYMLPWTFCLF